MIMPLKRDNWTNEEVIGILKGLMITSDKIRKDDAQRFVNDHNSALQTAVEEFEAMRCSSDEWHAMAYDTESKFIVHIGPILPR